MRIQNDCVVSFHYRLSDDDGAEVGNSHEGEPITYLHGHGTLVPGLEAGLVGHASGDRLQLTVPPEQAYGLARDLPPERIPLKRMLQKKRPRPGDTVAFRHDEGTRQGVVLKVGRFTVDIDPNHPLAGRRLHFEIEVIAVRAASAAELDHGHAHGAGGHEH